MNNRKPSKRLQYYAILITIAFLVEAIVSALIFHRVGYDKKDLEKMEVIETNHFKINKETKKVELSLID